MFSELKNHLKYLMHLFLYLNIWIDFIFRSRLLFSTNCARHIQKSIKSMNGLGSASYMDQTVSFFMALDMQSRSAFSAYWDVISSIPALKYSWDPERHKQPAPWGIEASVMGELILCKGSGQLADESGRAACGDRLWRQ